MFSSLWVAGTAGEFGSVLDTQFLVVVPKITGRGGVGGGVRGLRG